MGPGFATDVWTSPNHRAFIAVTVHFEEKGVSISMLLDIVEVAQSDSGLNLAAVFAGILDEFGISKKISYYLYSMACKLTVYRFFQLPATMHQTTIK